MDWLALAVLGIIWGVLLVPGSGRREPNPLRRPVFFDEEEFRHPGRRWILSPRRGTPFVGRRQRARLRARERRRRVFLFLLELIGITGLIGMFPPLRGMLVVTGFVVVLLVVYTAMVVWAGRGLTVPQPAEAPDQVVVLPDVEADPLLEAQDRRVVRVAAR